MPNKPHIRLRVARLPKTGALVYYLEGKDGQVMYAFSMRALFFNPYSRGWQFVLESGATRG